MKIINLTCPKCGNHYMSLEELEKGTDIYTLECTHFDCSFHIALEEKSKVITNGQKIKKIKERFSDFRFDYVNKHDTKMGNEEQQLIHLIYYYMDYNEITLDSVLEHMNMSQKEFEDFLTDYSKTDMKRLVKLTTFIGCKIEVEFKNIEGETNV